MTDKEFDKRIGDALRDLKEQPPRDMFSRIERTLVEAGASPSVTSGKAGKVRFFSAYGRYAAVAAAVALFVVTLFTVKWGGDDIDKTPAQVAEEIIKSSDTAIIDVPKLVAEHQERLSMSESEPVMDSEPIRLQFMRFIAPLHELLSDDFDPERPVGMEFADGNVPLEITIGLAFEDQLAQVLWNNEIASEETDRSQQYAEAQRHWAQVMREEERRLSRSGKDNNFAAALYGGNFGTGSGDIVTKDMTLLAKNEMLIHENPMLVPGADDLSYDGPKPSNVPSSPGYFSEGDEAMLKHMMPINIGFTLSFPLSDKFSITTGLNYSYLHSSTKQKLSNANARLTREQHYVGIPVGVNYSIYSNRRFDFYVQGGAMMEKAVYVADKKKYDSGSAKDTESKQYDIKGFQPSVNASVGASLKLGDRVGIYLEPGIAYYFERPNERPSYRTENPTNFTVRVGVRFDLY